MTTLTLENESGIYSIKLDREYLNFEECVDNLVKPIFLAAGYSKDTINKYIE